MLFLSRVNQNTSNKPRTIFFAQQRNQNLKARIKMKMKETKKRAVFKIKTQGFNLINSIN